MRKSVYRVLNLVLLSIVLGVACAPGWESNNLYTVGRWPFGSGSSLAVTEREGKTIAFLGSGTGVMILDATNGADPQLISDDLRTPDLITGLDVQGERLLVAAGEAGLRIYDVSDLKLPQEIGLFNVNGLALKDIEVREEIAFLLSDGPGHPTLFTVDVRDATAPKLLGMVTLSASAAHRMRLAGDYIYVAAGRSGWLVIDVSNPGGLSEVASHSAADVLAVEVSGNFLYVGYGGSSYAGFIPLAFILTNLPDPTGSSGYAIRTKYASNQNYLGEPVSGDSRQLAKPPGFSSPPLTSPYGGLSGFKVFDVSDAQNPVEVADLTDGRYGSTGNWERGGSVSDIIVLNDRALLSVGRKGPWVFDVSDPGKPQKVAGQEDVFAGAYFLGKNRLYGLPAQIDELTTGLVIMDLTNPDEPIRTGAYALPGLASAVFIRDQSAVVFEWKSTGLTLRTLDLSDPAVPRETGVSSITRPSEQGNLPVGFSATKDRVYLLEAGPAPVNSSVEITALRVLDLRDLTRPAQIGYYAGLPGNSTDFVVTDELAYVTTQRDGLTILDISDSEAITEASHVAVTRPGNQISFTTGLFVEGNTAYIAAEEQGLKIFDVSNPAEPRELADYYPDKIDPYSWSSKVEDVVVKDGYAFLLASGRLRIVDVRDPYHPAAVSLPDLESLRVSRIVWDGTYLYLSLGSKGSKQILRVIDISNPTEPVAIGDFAGSYVPVSSQGYIHLVAGFGGLITIKPIGDKGILTTGQVKLEGRTSHQGARITFQNSQHNFLATTDESGNFSIALLEGTYQMEISSSGYLAVFRQVTAASGAPLELPEEILAGGDVNGDFQVAQEDLANIADLIVFMNGRITQSYSNFPSDINDDRRVDNLDLSIAQGNLGKRSAIRSVPE